ncbi:MAG: hypothetical protein LBR86_00165, partial [Tannerella sp.]|nr:hypothetical protein [Tannerella sp.]
SREEMDASIGKHNITSYFDMFSKFGQTGEPTFSHVRISTDAIVISTYTVDTNGNTALFDTIRIVR